MKSLKGTQTEKNLVLSFAGESQARNRYTYFASVAKKEGFEQIAAIFQETADQEKEHAKRMFKWLEGGSVEITASYPAGVIGKTIDNLQIRSSFSCLSVYNSIGYSVTVSIGEKPDRKHGKLRGGFAGTYCIIQGTVHIVPRYIILSADRIVGKLESGNECGRTY